MISLGYVELKLDKAGKLFMGQHWNPSQMDKETRVKVVRCLREVADNMELDRFGTGDDYEEFPIKD